MNNPNPEVDKGDMFSVLLKFPDQIEVASKLGKDISFEEEIDSIVIVGMGGSALAGDILKCYLHDLKIPITVAKGYTLPAFVNEKTLVFAISYSGNTEETIESYRQAVKRNAQIVAIGSGGKLEDLATKLDRPFIKVKSGFQPRMAYASTFIPILNVLYNCNIIDDPKKDIDKTKEAVKSGVLMEKARDLAKKLHNKIPLIYSSDKLSIISYKWKIDFNENTKVHAFSNVVPEMNHNEINGYVNLTSTFHVIMLEDEEDNRRVKKRYDINAKIIKSKGVGVTHINITGTCLLSRMFSAMRIGDWTSYYLALHYQQDPTPVDIIEDLKKMLVK